MLTVTDNAKSVLQTVSHPAGTVLRLEPISDERVGLVVGDAKANDEVIEKDGDDVLHVAAPLSAILDGSVMDLEESTDGSGLQLTVHAP